RHDAADVVDGDGEADAGRRARGADDGRVDADEPAAAIQERSARVARIDGRVGLDHAFQLAAVVAFDLPAQGADDAARERVIQAERIADGEDLLADQKL